MKKRHVKIAKSIVSPIILDVLYEYEVRRVAAIGINPTEEAMYIDRSCGVKELAKRIDAL